MARTRLANHPAPHRTSPRKEAGRGGPSIGCLLGAPTRWHFGAFSHGTAACRLLSPPLCGERCYGADGENSAPSPL